MSWRWYNPISWGAKRRQLKKGTKAMQELIQYLEDLIGKEVGEERKIYTLLEQLKAAPSLERQLQTYMTLKQEIQREHGFEKKVAALEKNLKVVLGDNLKHMHEQL